MNGVMEQAAFDIDTLLAEVNPETPRPPYTGRAPLHFTVDFYTVAELTESWMEWVEVNGNFDCIRVSHMWHGFREEVAPATGHAYAIMSAALHCDHWGRGEHYCVGGTVFRTQCDPCGQLWLGSEPQAIEAWHDHAWPGWRDLPVVPQDVRPVGGGIGKSTQAALAWVVGHYPTDWQKPGAPVITERAGIGTRHVAGYSPWGGYDLAAESLGLGIERAA